MQKKAVTSFILLTLLLISPTLLYAIPAIPDPVVMTQPDGKTLTVMIKGDERINWYESMDGYTLLFNQAGYLSYAQLDENRNLQPSNYIATDIEKRDIVISSFLNTLEKKLFYSDVQTQLMLKVWEIEDDFAAQSANRGERLEGFYKTLCAFVQFPEKAMVKTISDFEGLMNQLGYTGNSTGSVRDFFKESSYGKFDLVVTLCGIYTAPNSQTYYAGSGGTANCGPLARWAAQQVAAEPDINFADYSTGTNNQVDGFHFIFAGEGREAGGGPETIWSHKSQFSTPVTKNGKSISVYSCSPELLYSNITTIGVICHEMTHAFGAPDFYDTNGNTGGQFEGTGRWDLMAGGSWNGIPGGNRPAHHNMFTKIQFGWVTPVVLNSPTTILNMPNSAENPVAYRINTSTNNEYYLLENRQRIKFDTSVPGSGLIVYHVHSGVNNAGNCINCNHPQRMYPVCASRTTQMPGSSPSSYGNINSGGCPFPGTTNKTSFTDSSTPAMKSWNNNNNSKPITNITHVNQLITFEFMGGGSVPKYDITATCDSTGTITPLGVSTVFEGFSQSYTISPNSYYNRSEVLINGVNDPEAVSTGKYTFTNVTSNQTIHATFALKTYMVTYRANGGTGTMPQQVFTYGILQNLLPCNFTKENAIFTGWNTHIGGSGKDYEDQESISISANLVLNAQWVDYSSIVEKSNHSYIQIIPNPANDYVDLRFTISGDGVVYARSEIVFYNVFGQLVKSVPLSGEIVDNTLTQRISIADLNKGIYFVKIGTETVKLVKQ